MICPVCNSEIENDSDFCYYCGKIFNEENVEMDGFVENSENIISPVFDKYAEDDFDFYLHGENYLFDIKGCRGRRIVVYENKCVIKVGVTIGSIVAKNALDGEKTIYYKDVVGVQFKTPGTFLVFLQLETASSKGNNLQSNFFDENSFTFEKNFDKTYEAYKYIIKRLDEIKSL